MMQSNKPFVNPVTSQLAVAAESQFLGAILLSSSRKYLSETSSLLSVSDFWDEIHSLIYRAMLSILESTNKPIDQIAVAHEIANLTNNQKSLCSDLSLLIANCYTPLDYMHYAQEVKEFANQRRGEPRQPRFKGGINL